MQSREEYHQEARTGYRPVPMMAVEHLPRRFRLTFDNAKKHGRYPIRHYTTYGCEFPDGPVAISTNAFGRRGFESVREMHEAMEFFGNITIDYID